MMLSEYHQSGRHLHVQVIVAVWKASTLQPTPRPSPGCVTSSLKACHGRSLGCLGLPLAKAQQSVSGAAPPAPSPPLPAPSATSMVSLLTAVDHITSGGRPCSDAAPSEGRTSLVSRHSKLGVGSNAGPGSARPTIGARQREEDYYEVCHTDVVRAIIISDSGRIFTGG